MELENKYSTIIVSKTTLAKLTKLKYKFQTRSIDGVINKLIDQI